MSRLQVLIPVVACGVAGSLLAAAGGQPKDEKPAHSAFYRDFNPESMVALCRNQFKFVKDKCGTGSRGIGIKWDGETTEEGFKVFDLTGDLSGDEVKQVLATLKAELVKQVRTSKAALGHDPKDTVADRPMRLLQPGLLWAGTAVVPSGLRGFYFPYKDKKVDGWVDVLAVPMIRDKKTEWLILGAVHEVAR
jgi:hypothetical protein